MRKSLLHPIFLLKPGLTTRLLPRSLHLLRAIVLGDLTLAENPAFVVSMDPERM